MKNLKCTCSGPTDRERAALPELDLDNDMNFHERHCQFFIEQKFMIKGVFQKLFDEAGIKVICPEDNERPF